MNKVKCLIYCTKNGENLLHFGCGTGEYRCITNKKQKDVFENEGFNPNDITHILNGKIVAQFDCEKVDYYEIEYHKNNLVLNQIGIYDEYESKEWEHDCFKRVISNEYSEEEIANCELIKKSCLSFDELGKYVCFKNGIDNFYAIHISNLEIFDEPKELAKHTLDNNSDFYIKKWIKKFDSFKGSALTKAPQNMFNVYDKDGNHYVLISIRPEWVAKILNGEKTIEVRKSIVNKLKELI